MKTTFLLLFMTTFIAKAQISPPVKIPPLNVVQKYKDERPDNTQRKDGKEVFNDKMLNILFADKVGTAFGGSSDLSLQKFFASLDAGENSISLGGNFDNRNKDIQPLIWVLSTGVKMKAKDQFATFYKNGDFQESNVGGFFKLTRIFSGSINFHDKEVGSTFIRREQAVADNREYLYAKYQQKEDKYINEEADVAVERQKKLEKSISETDTSDEILEKKRDELYTEMAKEEIKFIEDHHLYRFLINHWISADVYIPFGRNEYKTTPDAVLHPLSDKKFYAVSGSLTYNFMMLFSSGESLFLKARGTLKNNNNIAIDAMKTTPFQTVTTGANNTSVITNIDDGYITNFERFLTTTLTIEPAFFTFNNTVGFSPAVEFNVGKYNKTNWKLGIPVSLKDKDGKPKVNFELQWKEINTFQSSDHIVGVSVNFLFGGLIN